MEYTANAISAGNNQLRWRSPIGKATTLAESAILHTEFRSLAQSRKHQYAVMASS